MAKHEKSASASVVDLRPLVDDFVSLLGGVYNLDRTYPGPQSYELGEIKRWASGPIEEGGFQSRKSFSEAASRFLFRKVLPSSADNPVPSYLQKLGTEKPSNPDFMDFCKQKIPELFKRGWDKNYKDFALRATVGIKASFSTKRSEGGARAEILETLGHEEFLSAVLGERFHELPPQRKVVVIDDSGKKRIVTVASALQSALLPLHLCMYSHLSKKEWLLRGDAKPSAFTDFTLTRGEVFISGDYEAATDNFVQAHSACILDAVLETADFIPPSIKVMAASSLTSILYPKYGAAVVQRSGQLMGNFLSFPLLCLMNFLAFKYAIPRKVPVRINGDDIVFRARKHECEVWRRTVSDSGLVLSPGKTLEHHCFFSVNSTFFQAGHWVPSLVPVIRSSSLYKKVEKGGVQLRSRLFKVGEKFWPQARRLIKTHLLRFHRKSVKSAGCSVNRGLGSRADPDMLRVCDLLDHEIHYFQFPAELDVPPRERGSDMPGWRKKKVTRREYKEGKKRAEEGFSDACYQQAWSLGAEKYRSNAGKQVEIPPVGYAPESMWRKRRSRGDGAFQGVRNHEQHCSACGVSVPGYKDFVDESYGEGKVTADALAALLKREPSSQVTHRVWPVHEEDRITRYVECTGTREPGGKPPVFQMARASSMWFKRARKIASRGILEKIRARCADRGTRKAKLFSLWEWVGEESAEDDFVFNTPFQRVKFCRVSVGEGSVSTCVGELGTDRGDSPSPCQVK